MVFSHISPLIFFFLSALLAMSVTSVRAMTMTPPSTPTAVQAPQQAIQPQGFETQDLKQLLSSNDYMAVFLHSMYLKVVRSLRVPENKLYDVNSFDPLQKIFIHKFFSEDPFFIALIRFSSVIKETQFQDLILKAFSLHQTDLGLEKTKQTIEATYLVLKNSKSLPSVAPNSNQAAEVLNNFIYSIIFNFIAGKETDYANYLWNIYQKLSRKEALSPEEKDYYESVKDSFDELNEILTFFVEVLTQNKFYSAVLNEDLIVELMSIVNALLDFCRNREDVLNFKTLFSAYRSMIEAGIVKGQ